MEVLKLIVEALNGEWGIAKVVPEGDRNRVHFVSLANPAIEYTILQFAGQLPPPVGSVGRIGWIANDTNEVVREAERG